MYNEKVSIILLDLYSYNFYVYRQMLENQLMEIICPAILSTSLTAQQTFGIHLKQAVEQDVIFLA